MSNQAMVVQNKREIRDFIQSDAVKDQLALALPKHMTPDRMARVACTAILKTPKLMECKQESLLQALMICSQVGLEPDGRNAHLIPYGDQVQVIFDYKGLVALAERNGVECIYADKVCENDAFEARVVDGEKKLDHRVDWRKPRGNAFAYYVSCRRNGRLDYEIMQKDEVDAVRKRSRAAGSGPWVTDYDEMAKKTVIKRMSKRWDITPELRDALDSDYDTPDFSRAPMIEQASFVRRTEPVAALPQGEADHADDAAKWQELAIACSALNMDFAKFKAGAVSTNFWPEAKDWKQFSDVSDAVAAKIIASQSSLERWAK